MLHHKKANKKERKTKMANMSKDRQIYVNASDIEQIIFATTDLCEALWHNGYDVKESYILSADKAKTPEQNALAFVEQKAELTGAALRMIASATGIISRGISNGEIIISLGDEDPITASEPT